MFAFIWKCCNWVLHSALHVVLLIVYACIMSVGNQRTEYSSCGMVLSFKCFLMRILCLVTNCTPHLHVVQHVHVYSCLTHIKVSQWKSTIISYVDLIWSAKCPRVWHHVLLYIFQSNIACSVPIMNARLYRKLNQPWSCQFSVLL